MTDRVMLGIRITARERERMRRIARASWTEPSAVAVCAVRTLPRRPGLSVLRMAVPAYEPHCGQLVWLPGQDFADLYEVASGWDGIPAHQALSNAVRNWLCDRDDATALQELRAVREEEKQQAPGRSDRLAALDAFIQELGGL
ncbi:hypothetical protein [Streptomyces fractus]|uniref:hypothetical protein n=1 Tax=Streptomyces fractus TaxID=641806 RepID=UPI003CF335C7